MSPVFCGIESNSIVNFHGTSAYAHGANPITAILILLLPFFLSRVFMARLAPLRKVTIIYRTGD